MAKQILTLGVSLLEFDSDEYLVNVYAPDHIELVRLKDKTPVVTAYGPNILWSNLKEFSPSAPASGVKIEMPKEPKSTEKK